VKGVRFLTTLLAISALIAENKYNELKIEIELNPQSIFLVDAGNETMLMRAAIYNASDSAEILIQAGIDKDQKNTIGRTALMIASDWGYFKTVQVLLNKGAEISFRDKNGQSAFDMAIERTVYIKNKYQWFELFGLYKDKLDAEDLAKFHEKRLPVLFKG
jgi:ankyrin repeat protein